MTAIVRNVLVGLLLVASSASYMLDTSCKGDPNETFIDNGVKDAVKLAQDAFNLLSARPWNTPNNPNQVYSDLANWIFKEDGSTAHVDFNPQIPKHFDSRDSLSVAQDIYGSITDMGPKVPEGGGGFEQVRFFCDLSRYGPSAAHPDKFFSLVDKIFKKKRTPEDVSPCEEEGSLFDRHRTMAYTTVPIQPEDQPIAEEKQVTIQICPEYLIKSIKAARQSSNKIFNAVKVNLAKWRSTAMDTYALFDCTVLHEFTHTYAGAQRGDIDSAYGWKAAVALSHDDSIKNADNFVWFALGVRLIMNQNLRPQQDGGVTRP